MKRDSQCHKATENGTINDEELEKVIRDRLRNNPLYYLNFLRKLLDEIDENIPDDIFFELLQPSSWRKNGENGISDSIIPVPSPESVDMLFRPGARRKLYDWQRAFFDDRLQYTDRDKALNNIKKIFYSLTHKWKDGVEATPREDKGRGDFAKDTESVHEHKKKKKNVIGMRSEKKDADLKTDSKRMKKRVQKRFIERCKVKFAANGITFRGISSDFSLSGLFIKTNHPFTPGTILDILIYLPNGLISKLKGKVKRAVEASFGKVLKTQKYLQRGIGVEITEKDTNYLHFIRSLLDLEISRKRYAWSEISKEEFEEKR